MAPVISLGYMWFNLKVYSMRTTNKRVVLANDPQLAVRLHRSRHGL